MVLRTATYLLSAASLVLAATAFCVPAMGGAVITTEVLTEKSHFDIGEHVNVTVVVRNEGDETVTLAFPSSLQAYFTVEDGEGNVLFNLKHHVVVAWWLTDLVLKPGESKTYLFEGAESWKQVDDDGNPVPIPGEYTIRGVLDCGHPYETGFTVIALGYVGNYPEFTAVVPVVFALAVACVLMMRRMPRRK